ncbi:PKD domain-containing protein [Methanogenium cariaci]|uniref:PKD domain-containing protein n=1 Tax=Methanogenium cariaci TaxID=2197 RepID=UPI0007866D01|nr:PKD domain-containing protein [Methanogenium cariaci]
MVIEDGVNEDNYALAKLTTAYSGELPPDLPVAGFSVDDPTGERYAGRVPLTVQFTDTSTGVIDSYAWDFGADGTIDSIERNPVWICEIPGLYTVNLTVTNRAGSDTYSWSNCIRATITSGPDIQSVHCYGGNETDRFTAGCPAGDGGHIFIGETYSVESGDVTTNHGSRDYWVVKTDANENLEWQRCYGGGTGYDYGYAICTANDGGYLIGGRTKSTDCEVTDNHGGYDAWMVKIDAAGVPEWKKCYGGTNTDEVKDVLQTTDGGYLMVGGDSKSTDGDLTGIPTEGGYDSWVIKTDESGTIEWQERYGGSKNDYLVSGLETGDGNYVLCGYSQSYNGDLTLNHGNYDCWIMQINSTGGLQWQKSFGGKSSDKADCLIQTTDGGYLMGGFTKSSDGDVTGYHGGYSEDGWLVKTDSDGVLEWQKCYGGTDKEFIRALRERPDGGYIIAGDSESDDGDLEGYFNYYQGSEIYVIGISSTGDIEWQKLIGGHLNDRSYVFCTKDNGDYLIGGRSSSRNRDMYLANAHGDGGDGCVVVLEGGAGVPFAAQFEADVTTGGAAPLTVQFTDLSTGEDITAWAWDFDNDGTTDSIEENPVYTYDTAGVYSVSLTVTNVSGTSTETKADYITVDAGGVLRLDFDPLTSTVVCGESTEYAVVLESVPTACPATT